MFINDSLCPFFASPFGARLTRAAITATLAASIIGAAVASSNASTPNFTEVATNSYHLSPSLFRDGDQSPPSFGARFEGAQAAIMHDIVGHAFETSPSEPLTTASLPRQQTIIPAGETIVGIASTYNPTDPNDRDAGGLETASGEQYDAGDWTAAIRTDLRVQFGGVRYGRNYVPTFALVESNDKRVIVRINDVGPLRPGRIIDFNQRTMEYFDPTLQRGLIADVSVTPLAGQDWALGPVVDDFPINVAGGFD